MPHRKTARTKKTKGIKQNAVARIAHARIVRARRTARNVPDAVKTKNAASAGIAGTKDIAVTTAITARTEGITTAEEAVAAVGANPLPA